MTIDDLTTGHRYGDGTHYPPTGGAHVIERCRANCPPQSRPVVDREALKQALNAAAASRETYDSCVFIEGTEDDFADAVLALLNGGAS